MTFRIYIDESGDHSYRGLNNPGRRYLGLTGVVFRKAEYDPAIPLALEALKRRHFPHDVDFPLVLHRKDLIQSRSLFGVLEDEDRRSEWEEQLVEFLRSCPMNVFTTVFDKKAHLDSHGFVRARPYDKCMSALLCRVAAWLLSQQDATADVLVESRSARSDWEAQDTFTNLRMAGCGSIGAAQFSRTFYRDELLFRTKVHNVAGLQIADMIVTEQTRLAIEESGRPLTSPIGPFGRRVNEAVEVKAGTGSRMLLQ